MAIFPSFNMENTSLVGDYDSISCFLLLFTSEVFLSMCTWTKALLSLSIRKVDEEAPREARKGAMR